MGERGNGSGVESWITSAESGIRGRKEVVAEKDWGVVSREGRKDQRAPHMSFIRLSLKRSGKAYQTSTAKRAAPSVKPDIRGK